MTTLHPTVEQAQALIDFERFDQAAALLGRHLAEEPDDIRAWVKIGYCRLNTQRPQQALEASDAALELAPEDHGALLLRADALVRLPGSGAWRAAEPVLREAVRVAPHDWYACAMLADAVWRMSVVRYAQATGATELQHHELAGLAQEATDLVREAIRLGPEEVYPLVVAQQIADFTGNATEADRLERAILRLDPTHRAALEAQTRKAAGAPGVKAPRAADLYAAGLAAAPDSAAMQDGLDRATYRMLRGMRWLALLGVGLAGAMMDLYIEEGEVPSELPLPLGQRLWYLVPMTAIWIVGALLRHRRRRTGVRLNVRSLLRRAVWARIVIAQAAWAMLCALLIAEVPWTDRLLPQVLFWAGLVPTLATIWFDRPKAG